MRHGLYLQVESLSRNLLTVGHLIDYFYDIITNPLMIIILGNRCSLNYPNDVYKYETKPSYLMTGYSLENSGYKDHVWEYLWKQVKHSDCCCCESKFYCSSSKNREKCTTGCCGKCKGIKDSESEVLKDSMK